MKRLHIKKVLAALLFAVLFLPGATAPPEPDSDIPDISKRINTFTVELLKHSAESENAPANAILSPQSIFHGLAMSYIASGDQTRGELAGVLHFPNDNEELLKGLTGLRQQLNAANKHKRIDVSMDNSLWLDERYADFRKDYVEKLQDAFGAPLHRVDFAQKESASDQINNWVSEKTHGEIQKCVGPNDFESRSGPGVIDEPALVTVNAVYFKADWGSQFDKESTRKRPFYTDAATTTETTMMHQCSLLPYSENEKFKFLEIPYIAEDYSMHIVLPKEIVSIGTLMDGITTEMIEGLKRNAYACNADVLLPKFEMKSHYPMKNMLSEMGLESAFDNQTANFDKMINKKIEAYRIYIGEIYHDAWIDVDEEGTEAVAATATAHRSYGCSASPPPRPVQFHADHPFLFMIVHNPSRSILFAGWMSKPE